MDVFQEPLSGPGRNEGKARRAATFTTIAGNSFVSDLYWQTLERPRNYMAEAKEIGKRDGLDIVAIRDTISVKQAGFVRKADGAVKGMYSLAASLSGQLGETWIGAFRLPDGQFAMVAVDQGAIIPGADIIADRTSVLRHFRRIYGRGTTDFKENIYAPADFEYGGTEQDVEELLKPARLKKEYRLRPLTFGLSKKEWIKVGFGSIALLTAAVAFIQWQSYQEQQARIERALAAQLEAQRLAALNANTRAEQAPHALKHPWATMVGAGDFITACTEALAPTPLAIGGWIATSARCSREQFAVSYVRQGVTTVEQFRAAAASLFSLAPAFTDGGDTASLNKPLQMTLAGDEELSPIEDVLSKFNSHLQQIAIKPSLTEVPYTPPTAPAPLPGDKAEAPPAPPAPFWSEFAFAISTEIPPHILAQGMPGRGVRISEIEVVRTDASRLVWTIKGGLYGKK